MKTIAMLLGLSIFAAGCGGSDNGTASDEYLACIDRECAGDNGSADTCEKTRAFVEAHGTDVEKPCDPQKDVVFCGEDHRVQAQVGDWMQSCDCKVNGNCDK